VKIVVHQRPQAAFLGTPQASGLRHDTLDRSPNTASSFPPDDEAQRFADFFLQGSHNLRQYNAEYDDIGAAVDKPDLAAQPVSAPNAPATSMDREEQLAELLRKKTAVGGNAMPRFGSAVNRPRKTTKIEA
jgi:hypothetical protein